MHVRRGGEKHTGAQIYRLNCFDFDSLLWFHRQKDGTHDVHISLAGKETHSVFMNPALFINIKISMRIVLGIFDQRQVR